MPKCYEYVYFLRFHEIVLMYSYNLSITGWVPNLRESSHGHCVRFDVLFIPEKGSCSCPGLLTKQLNVFDQSRCSKTLLVNTYLQWW